MVRPAGRAGHAVDMRARADSKGAPVWHMSTAACAPSGPGGTVRVKSARLRVCARMAEPQKISSLVTGGEASAGPPLGPALGPLGVNIMEVIGAINEKTADFKGMKVPVTVSVDPDTKKWDIEIGVPSVAALLLKETGLQKGSGTPGTEWVGDIGMDAIAKIAKTKIDGSYATSIKSVAKSVIGTCVPLGIKVEGKTPKEITAEINESKWDDALSS